MTRTYIFVVAMLLGMTAGVGLAYYAYKSWNNSSATHAAVSSEVLLEKIRKVYKIVVVEGEFADIVSHHDYYQFDLPGFRKKALIRVKAKVQVGYDLAQLNVSLDPANKVLHIGQLPEPQILSIDTDLNYYDLENGLFNSFTPAELSKLQKTARDTMQYAAMHSKLIPTAREQAKEMFSLVTQLAEESGWRVQYDQAPALPASLPQPPPVTKQAARNKPIHISQ